MLFGLVVLVYGLLVLLTGLVGGVGSGVTWVGCFGGFIIVCW